MQYGPCPAPAAVAGPVPQDVSCPQAPAFLTILKQFVQEALGSASPWGEAPPACTGTWCLSQPPPKIGTIYPAIPWAAYSLLNLCSCGLLNGCAQCLQDLACLLFICSLGYHLAAISVFSLAIWGPWSQEDIYSILPSASAVTQHPK